MNSLINKYESNVIPLNKEKNLAYFKASISGRDSDYKKSAEAQIALDKIHSDQATFAEIKDLRESGEITEPTLKRQLEIVYLAYLGKQIDEKTLEELINRQGAVEQKFNSYRAKVNGQELSDNQIDSILKTSTDSVELKETWEASKTDWP